jgi:GntR family transcriptional regulator
LTQVTEPDIVQPDWYKMRAAADARRDLSMATCDFTTGARNALKAAREAAAALGHESVGTEHMLAGLMQTPEAKTLRQRLRLDREEVERRIATTVRPGKARIPPVRALPYTDRAKAVLELAMASGRELKHSHVGTEHLLLGLLREDGIAAQLLNDLGVTVESATRAIRGEDSAERFHVRIDAAAEVSIYEQIVAQVQEAVATGLLSPGERLPTVRQLADELDIAPGTVARAYGELERRGVVVTEGARGTRVAERERPAEPERPETLMGLLRPVAVAAFHMGASAHELRSALERAMTGIFTNGN